MGCYLDGVNDHVGKVGIFLMLFVGAKFLVAILSLNSHVYVVGVWSQLKNLHFTGKEGGI